MRLLTLLGPLLATLAVAVPTPDNAGGGEEGRCGYFLIGDYKVPLHDNGLCNHNYNFNWFYIKSECDCHFYYGLECNGGGVVEGTINAPGKTQVWVSGPFEGTLGAPGQYNGHECWWKGKREA